MLKKPKTPFQFFGIVRLPFLKNNFSPKVPTVNVFEVLRHNGCCKTPKGSAHSHFQHCETFSKNFPDKWSAFVSPNGQPFNCFHDFRQNCCQLWNGARIRSIFWFSGSVKENTRLFEVLLLFLACYAERWLLKCRFTLFIQKLKL